MSVLRELKKKKEIRLINNGRIYNTNLYQTAPIIRPSEVIEDFWTPARQDRVEYRIAVPPVEKQNWWTRANPEGISNKDVFQMFLFFGSLWVFIGLVFYFGLKK